MTHTLEVSLPVSLKTSLVLQTVAGDEPQKTLKRLTFRPSKFFKNVLKKREEEDKQKEKNTIKVQAEVHRETPRRLNICRATMRPPRPSSTAECLRLIAHLQGEQASAASWEPRPPFEAAEMD